MINSVTSIEVIPYSEFKYWFVRVADIGWQVYTISDNSSKYYEERCNVLYLPDSDVPADSDIQADFNKFASTRPEYYVGRSISADIISDINAAAALYEVLIVGTALIRAKANGCDNPDEAAPRITPCLQWLKAHDFYTAPASSIYHESHPGGLLQHTLKVVNRVVDLMSTDAFSSVTYAEAILCALVHDWCKIDQYEQYMRNVKNEDTGAWEKVPSYRRKNAMMPLGHGVASMYLASKFFKLSPVEALAIRWHMSVWRAVPSEYDELQLANESTPLVHLIQFADQLAITKYIDM